MINSKLSAFNSSAKFQPPSPSSGLMKIGIFGTGEFSSGSRKTAVGMWVKSLSRSNAARRSWHSHSMPSNLTTTTMSCVCLASLTLTVTSSTFEYAASHSDLMAKYDLTNAESEWAAWKEKKKRKKGEKRKSERGRNPTHSNWLPCISSHDSPTKRWTNIDQPPHPKKQTKT